MADEGWELPAPERQKFASIGKKISSKDTPSGSSAASSASADPPPPPAAAAEPAVDATALAASVVHAATATSPPALTASDIVTQAAGATQIQVQKLQQQIQQLKQQQQQMIHWEEQLGRQNQYVQSSYNEVAPSYAQGPQYGLFEQVSRDRAERDRLERAVAMPALALGLVPRGGGAPPEVVLRSVEPPTFSSSAPMAAAAAAAALKRPREDDVSDEFVERVAARVMQRVRAELSSGWVELLSAQRAVLDGMLRSIRENN